MSEQRDRILETMRRVLQQTTLRAILRPLGRTPLDVREDEKEALLAPFETQIENDFVMCCEVADQLVALAMREQSTQEPLMLATVNDTIRLSTEDEA